MSFLHANSSGVYRRTETECGMIIPAFVPGSGPRLTDDRNPPVKSAQI